MDLRSHFSSRKSHISSESRRNGAKKLADEHQVSPLSLGQNAHERNNILPTESVSSVPGSQAKNELLARLALAKKPSGATEKGKNSSKTLLEFLRDPERIAAQPHVIKDFQTSVATLQRTPEKLQRSPYYSPHKTCLTNAQSRTKLGHSSVRKQLFSKSSPSISSPEASISEPQEVSPQLPESMNSSAEAETALLISCDQSANQPRRTPVKTRPEQNNASLPVQSPGKRMLLFSPSKGLLATSIPTATSIHTDAICEGLPTGMSVKEASSLQLANLAQSTPSGKRKADFDRSEIKRRLENQRAARNGAESLLRALEAARPNQVSQPAKERFASLAAATPGLPVPISFKKLYKLFDNMDFLMSLNHRQTTYYETLRDNMRQMTMELHGRLLEYNDLGRIRSVFPEAYIFRVQKPVVSGLELVPSDKEQMAIYIRDDTKCDQETDIFQSQLLGEDRARRRDKFEASLLAIVHREHANFLAAQDPPVVLAPGKIITNWHAKFRVDELSLPEPAKLPEFSRPKIARSAAEVIAMTPKPFLPRSSEALTADVTPAKPVAAAPVHPALKKVNPAFLVRVRARQAERAANLITRDPEIDKRMKILERIPSMARIILNDFWSNQKNTLEVAIVTKTLRHSMTTKLSTDEFKDHMDLLLEIFADKWLVEVSVRSGIFLKIHDVSVGLAEIDAIVQKEMDRLRAL